MAQFGRNYYGVSYYGTNGVFGGQFVSDETMLATSLSNVPPSDGKLYTDIICTHPIAIYTYPNEIFLRSGTWDGNTTSDASFVMTAELVAKNMVLNAVTNPSGATVKVETSTYLGGELVGTLSQTLDTAATSRLVIEPERYGFQVVRITHVSGGGFEFANLEANVTDIVYEFRAKSSEGLWTNWINLPLATVESDITYGSFSHAYKYTAVTGDLAGSVGYQFRVFLSTSDDELSPEIIILDVHTASTNDFAPQGKWKMTVDLGPSVTSIDTIDIDVVSTDASNGYIYSRTSNIDGNWSPWSVPYSSSPRRATLDYKGDSTLRNGYIMTPLISPENLTTWVSFLLGHYINNTDRWSGASTPGSSIMVEVVDADYDPLNPISQHVFANFTFSDWTRARKTISSIAWPCRLKINFTRTSGVASPAVDSVNIIADAYYKEYKTFGTGVGQFKGYGSAAYGHGTGIDTVYIDDVSRLTRSDISTLGFTLPSGVTKPEYVIEVDSDFLSIYPPEEVDLYWNTTGTKTVDVGDYVVCRVRPGNRIKKHYRYGSGISTVISPDYSSVSASGAFTPSIDSSIRYAYHVRNGFNETDANTRVDIRWSSENSTPKASRRNISYTLNDRVYVGIVSGDIRGMTDWVSEEKIFSGVVNANNPSRAPMPYSFIITDLPQIEPKVSVDPDPTKIPYKVEIVKGSVISHGERKPDTRLVGTVRYEYGQNNPSLVQTTEEKVSVIRGEGYFDYLPKAMVRSVSGIYSAATQNAPYYAKYVNDSVSYDYKHTVPQGSLYSNVIDWTSGITGNNGAKAPAPGTEYYVTYTYDKVVSLVVEFTCDYSEYELMPKIYRSPVITITGECAPMYDYVSKPISVVTEDGYTKLKCDGKEVIIDSGVDLTSLKYIVYDDNPRVRTYVSDSKLVATLDKVDPRESWNPYIYGGHYYLARNSYYMYTNPGTYKLDSSLIPKGDNILFGEGRNGVGVLMQEGTKNLLQNTRFEETGTQEDVFCDTFTRT